MRPNVIDVDLVDVDADGIATSQTPLAAGNLTLDGALTSGGVFTADVPRIILITAVGNESGRTFTVTGTDQNGASQTEAITGPNATTAASTKYWKTVTQIAVDDATANAVTVGTVATTAVASTHTYPLDYLSPYAANIHVDVTGTINFTVQETFVDVLGGTAPVWSSITALASKTADTTSTASVGATAVRLIVNSYSSGAELQFYTTQTPRD